MFGIYMKQFVGYITAYKKVYLRILKWCSLSLAGLFLAASVLFFTLQTDFGFNLFISFLNRSALEKNELKIEVKDIRGVFPFRFAIGDLSLYDRDGRWVQVHNFSLKINPFTLLKGRLFVETLHLEKTEISRLPARNNRTPRKMPEGFEVPAFLTRIKIEDIKASSIDLDGSILGAPAQFRLVGGMSDSGSEGVRNYNLEIVRIDSVAESLKADIHMGIRPQHMELKVDVQEPGKGIIYKLTGKGEDLRCLIEGSGNPDNWKGKLYLSSRKTGEINSEINIKIAGDDYSISTSGYFLFSDSLFEEKYSDLVGKGAEFTINADLFNQKELRLNLLRIKTEKLESGYMGNIRLANMDLGGTFSLKTRDAASLDKIAEGYSVDSLSVEGSINGKLFNPDVDLSYRLIGLNSDRINVLEIEGTGQGHFRDRNNPKDIMSVSGSGDIKGFSLRAGDQEYQEEKITCSFELVRDNNGQINVKLLNADSGNINFRTSGYLNAVNRTAHLEGRIDATDPGHYFSKASELLKGRGDIDFNFDADLNSKSFNGFLKGAYKLQLDNPGLKIFAGDTVRFESRVHFSDGFARVSDIRINSESISMEGAINYDQKGLVESEMALLIPDLSIASSYVKKDVSGRADINCSLNGEFSNFDTACSTKIEKFAWDKIKTDNISSRITAKYRDKNSSGKILIESISGDEKLKAGLDFYISGKDFSLKNLYLSGMGTDLSGSILFEGKARLINGRLNFSSPDISAISSLYGPNIEGSVSGEIVFKPIENAQNLEISASAEKITFNQDTVEDIDVKGSMTDVFGELKFSTSAAINGFNRRGVILKTVDIKGKGERNKSEFNINGTGTAGEEMDFTASMGFVNQGDAKSFRIQELNGRFGTSQVRSLQPLTVKYSAEAIMVENLDIDVDSGNISGSLNYNGDKVDGRIMVKSMPLSLLSLAGTPVLDGTLDSSLKLDGTSTSPVLSGIITADGIKRKSLKKNSIPPVTITAEYDMKKDSMSGKFSLDGMSGATLKGDISIPGDFSIYPFKLAPKDTDPIKGSIKGEFDLAVIPAVFEMHDQVIAGRLDTGFDISGYYGSPVIAGSALLSKGTYEHSGMGILVDNIEAEISADNYGITLHNFKAYDGLNGKISGSGHLDIDADKDFPYEVSIALKNMQLTGSKSLRTVAGGNAVISGSMKQHDLSGKLTLEKAEYEIAEKLPVEFTELEIKEINRDVETGQDETKPPAKGKINFDLAVSSPGRVYIKGRGLDSEWKGDVKLEGDSKDPVITGNFTLLRGNYNFLSRPFTLTEGQVTFAGNSPPDPYFDVTGKSVNSSITALINLRGSIKDPVLSLSSEPELPQDEILARVLFDREVSQITPLQALQLAAALRQMLGGKKGFDPLAYTRNLIGVDRLEVKQSEVNPDESALSAGKYLKDNIYIEVEKGVSDESGKASVTWELTPSITVETEVGEDSETGMGINWKHDY